MKSLVLTIIFLFSVSSIYAQVTPEDGDWASKDTTLFNTPEAQLMARTGDIDNLNFGWPNNFDPFSGNSTPWHGYPWAVDSTDPGGTDRIMVITSYTGNPPYGQDGYTSNTSRPGNNVQPVVINFPADSVGVITSALLQMFVDDFQATVWGASYEVYFDNVRVPFMEAIINGLVQTGPIGRIISTQIPADVLYLLNDGELSILIDDFTSGAGDGYAIDFAKILINPTGISQVGTIQGTVRDAGNSQPLENVVVVANGLARDTTDVNGFYQIDSVLAGFVNVKTYRSGYGSDIKTVLLAAGQTLTVDFNLQTPAPQIVNLSPAAEAVNVASDAVIRVDFNAVMDTLSFNNANFVLSSEDSTLSGQFQRADSFFIFIPLQPLPLNKSFTARVTTGVKNLSGVRLASDSSWVFYTFDPTGVTDDDIQPLSFILQQNYPNPFNPQTTISFTLEKAQRVHLRVFNLLGEETTEILSGLLKAGKYSVQWNAAGQPAGIYFYRLQGEKGSQVRKMVLLK